MAIDHDCFYCIKDQRLDALMVKVCELGASTLYLFKDQTHQGRSIVALKGHKKELFDLSREERNAFAQDLARTARALTELFSPGKINYAAFGDKVTHFHMHVVPKYETGPNWGSPFELFPAEKKFLPAEELDQLARRIEKKVASLSSL